MTKYLFALLPHVFLVSILALPMPIQAQIEKNGLGETNIENLNREIAELDNKKIDSLNQQLNELKESTKNKLLEIDQEIENIRDKQNQTINLGDGDTIPIEIKGETSINPIWLALISAFFGFLGGLALNILLKKEKTKEEKKSNTIEMWKYWDSASMRESRFNAWKTYYVYAKNATPESSQLESADITDKKKKEIEGNIADKLGEKLKKDYQDQGNTDAINVLRVSDFFRTLHYLKGKKDLKGSESIDEELAKYFFSGVYESWGDFFSADLKKGLEGSQLEGVVSKARQCNWLK